MLPVLLACSVSVVEWRYECSLLLSGFSASCSVHLALVPCKRQRQRLFSLVSARPDGSASLMPCVGLPLCLGFEEYTGTLHHNPATSISHISFSGMRVGLATCQR